MSILNTSPLNTATLGSKGAGSHRIFAQGSLVLRAVASVAVRPVTRVNRIYRPLLLHGWMFERPLRRVFVSGALTPSISPRFSPHAGRFCGLSTASPLAVAGSLLPRVCSRIRVSGRVVSSLDATCGGLDETTRFADLARTVFVSGAGRVSFVLGGR